MKPNSELSGKKEDRIMVVKTSLPLPDNLLGAAQRAKFITCTN